jgi:hypothetical protein
MLKQKNIYYAKVFHNIYEVRYDIAIYKHYEGLESLALANIRPHHFDVGVCVIPTFFLEIFGAKKKFPE